MQQPAAPAKKSLRERLKENLETVCFAIVIVGAVVSALMFLATKAEVEAVQQNLTINQVNDQIRETNSAIIQTDKQLMWMEKKLAAAGQDCKLDERWRELRSELDNLKLQRSNLYDQLKEMKTKK